MSWANQPGAIRCKRNYTPHRSLTDFRSKCAANFNMLLFRLCSTMSWEKQCLLYNNVQSFSIWSFFFIWSGGSNLHLASDSATVFVHLTADWFKIIWNRQKIKNSFIKSLTVWESCASVKSFLVNVSVWGVDLTGDQISQFEIFQKNGESCCRKQKSCDLFWD